MTESIIPLKASNKVVLKYSSTKNSIFIFPTTLSGMAFTYYPLLMSKVTPSLNCRIKKEDMILLADCANHRKPM